MPWNRPLVNSSDRMNSKPKKPKKDRVLDRMDTIRLLIISNANNNTNIGKIMFSAILSRPVIRTNVGSRRLARFSKGFIKKFLLMYILNVLPYQAY
jgi:hypothetical protein